MRASAKLSTVPLRDVINMSSTIIQNVRTKASKEWNKNSPDLVYHQLVPALFDVLWFETAPAVFTLLTVPVCYICHYFAMNIIMV